MGEERFRFTGEAGEYFRIWIVNLFLALATLGVYSAWAKVRKKRYFYGNTWLGGSNFDYHGDPIAILKGRLLAFAAFVAYTFAANFSPRAAALVLLALMPVIPWLVLRSFAFNARNSSHRNLRFHFDGSYRASFLAVAPFFILPASALMAPEPDPANSSPAFAQMLPFLVGPLAVMLFYPYIAGTLRRMHANGTRYGTAAFACSARIRAFYRLYFLAALIGFLLALALSLAMIPLLAGVPALIPVANALIYVAVVAVALGYTQSRLANLVFNATVIGGEARMRSVLRARRLARIYAVNLLAILLTLGLAIPWAAIRTARYRAESLGVVSPDLESFFASVSSEVPATGEELADIFDMDISL